jgi:FtsH-binding integral membrane protein
MFYTETVRYRSASELNTAMAGVYKNMSLAVIVSMLVSYWVGTTPALLEFFFTGWLKWVVIFLPLVAVFGISIAINADPPRGVAFGLLLGFAALMGLSFATIFAVYQMGSIVTAFMGAAVLFGVMSLYGYFTKQSLDSWGKYLFVALIAIIIASIINVFLATACSR